MTSYYFDTDCIAAFLWVGEEAILTSLFPGAIIIPEEVFEELSRVPPLRPKIKTLIDSGEIKKAQISIGSEEGNMFYDMISYPKDGMRPIGEGEAACIALVKKRGGCLASNNLKDIKQYVNRYRINHITTGDIMIQAMEQGLITTEEGNDIWKDMINCNRALPTESFAEYVSLKRKI